MDVSRIVRHMRDNDAIHPFEAYADRTGHYPRARIGDIRLSVRPSYIILRKRYSHDFYISRNDLLVLLRWLIPLVRRMEGSFDPDLAMEEYLREQDFYDDAIKKRRARKQV